jgi:hypothetical protein
MSDTLLSVPDAVFTSDNPAGVPTLDTQLQADCIIAPFRVWGERARKNKMTGTYHFYTDDKNFEALWKNPQPVINSGCIYAVEPNFSVYDDMPVAVALWHVYRKRWIARYWQSHGIKILVDLNVSVKHAKLNLLGVPHGWKSYATRIYSHLLKEAENEFSLACKHAGTDHILFVTYGGGNAAMDYAMQRNWIWYPESINIAQKRVRRHA